MKNLHKAIEALKVIADPEAEHSHTLAAIEEIVRIAMKADTFDLLDERGIVPATLSYRNLEGENEHGI